MRAILQEWARLGGATIVNGDRVTGPPVTLELTGVPERQALDIVLRSVAGYIVAPRPVGSQGVSAFDRIMILPTSVAPRAPAPAGRRRARAAGAPGRDPSAGSRHFEPGSDNADPLEDPTALIQGRDPRVVQPPFVMRPPVGDDANADPIVDEAERADPDAPAGVATDADESVRRALRVVRDSGRRDAGAERADSRNRSTRPTPNRVQ